jgi:hypothetical protein
MSTNQQYTETRCALRASAVTLVLALSIASSMGCGNQPKVNCQTSTAPFAMRLIVQGTPQESTPGACANFGPATFNSDPEVGFITYFAQDAKGQPDYSKGSVAVQTTEIGNLAFTGPDGADANTATDGKRYSLGAFDVIEPDANDICTAPTLAPTHLALPAVPDDPTTTAVDESAPPVDIRLVWSNVRVYVTAASFGTQIQADLVDTRRTPAGIPARRPTRRCRSRRRCHAGRRTRTGTRS